MTIGPNRLTSTQKIYMRKALAIDLDGTLLATNTFRDYLSYCLNASFHHFKLGNVFSIIGWVVLRKLRIISHSKMKYQLLRRTASFMAQNGRLDQFVEQELTCVNPAVRQLMEPYRNRGHLLILCTAAPGLYAHPIAENMGIDLCCATLLPSEVVIGEWRENVGTNKLEALQRLLQMYKAELEVVITDHHDDLPLLKYNAEGRNIVVGASSQTRQILSSECKTELEWY